MTDEELIEKSVLGDQRAQKALFDKYAPKMMALCVRYIPDRDAARDVLQDGFVKIFSNLKNFRGQGSFEGWIRKTMVNTALDQVRKSKTGFLDVDISQAQYLASESEHSIEKLRTEDLMRLIGEMPTGYRTVFSMYAIDGFSHLEIARELGVTESTSKTQYQKARNYLLNRIVERDNI